MKIKDAIEEVSLALEGYVNNCISTDKKSIQRLDTAWKKILATLEKGK